ncbi:hypothetical protein D3C80_700560 [compost metagenome]
MLVGILISSDFEQILVDDFLVVLIANVDKEGLATLGKQQRTVKAVSERHPRQRSRDDPRLLQFGGNHVEPRRPKLLRLRGCWAREVIHRLFIAPGNTTAYLQPVAQRFLDVNIRSKPQNIADLTAPAFATIFGECQFNQSIVWVFLRDLVQCLVVITKEFLERLYVMADFFSEREKLLQGDIEQCLTLHVVVLELMGCIKNGQKLVLVLLKRGND